MMPRDFSAVTEFPDRRLGREQTEIISRRYLFAADLAAGKRVLEVGCGPGLGLGYIAGVAASVVAGDVTTASLTRARLTYRGRPGIRLVRFDGQALPFRDASFDLVLAMAMIYYLDMNVFLGECRRVLAHGGIVAFCTPNRQCPGFRPSRFSTRYYTTPELVEVVEQHGFTLQLLGGFLAPRGRARLVQRAIALAGATLAVLPLAPGIRKRLKEATQRLIRYETHPLDGELTREHIAMVQYIPLLPLSTDMDAAEYRVLYGVARRCEDGR